MPPWCALFCCGWVATAPRQTWDLLLLLLLPWVFHARWVLTLVIEFPIPIALEPVLPGSLCSELPAFLHASVVCSSLFPQVVHGDLNPCPAMLMSFAVFACSQGSCLPFLILWCSQKGFSWAISMSVIGVRSFVFSELDSWLFYRTRFLAFSIGLLDVATHSLLT